MSKKHILLLSVLTCLVFGNCLFNGFVGDDSFLFVENDFYRSWSNLPRLFSSSYLMDSDEIFNNTQQQYSHSGSVAYRPVLSLTYFLDRALWGDQPWGYHFQNLLWHLFNGILVYGLVFLIGGKKRLAFFSALMFAVSPLKNEAVCAIGYRADSLACFFLLLSFLAFIRADHRAVGTGRILWRAASLGAFILGLLTKESVAVLPVLFLLYDKLIRKESSFVSLRSFAKRHGGHWIACLMYAYGYLFVFPNQTVGTVGLMGGSLIRHVLTILSIVGQYVTAFAIPPLVGILPPLYDPGINAAALLGLTVFALIGWAGMTYGSREGASQKELWFWLGWFGITLVPVLNIVPIVNPMAYRFMYLPSIGLTVWVLLLGRRIFSLPFFSSYEFLKKFMLVGWIVMSMIITFFLNTAWKDNRTMANRMILDHPQNPRGYLYAGINRMERGQFVQARRLLEQSLRLGLEDPRVYYYLGLCQMRDLKASAVLFARSIREFPRYGLAYIGLGRSYFLQGHIDQAMPYLKKGVALSPTYPGYAYLIQAYLLKGQPQEAERILKQALGLIREKPYRDSLNRFLIDKEVTLPIDVGL